MNKDKYVFSQIRDFLPQRVFDGIAKRHDGDKWLKGVRGYWDLPIYIWVVFEWEICKVFNSGKQDNAILLFKINTSVTLTRA